MISWNIAPFVIQKCSVCITKARRGHERHEKGGKENVENGLESRELIDRIESKQYEISCLRGISRPS
ncbi:MAG: hypothetical protein C4527_13705 [Candidatus Omnitrophota bacterium]|nr:MAG: hypothetical protein C4527_13705 [Candidatus Omnitrophota bacterium]